VWSGMCKARFCGVVEKMGESKVGQIEIRALSCRHIRRTESKPSHEDITEAQ
jgi:hypothetical protein